MKTITDVQTRKFIEACHRAAGEYGLLRHSSGNMSWRVDPERMLITGAGTLLGSISKDQVAVVRIADGMVLNKCRPSVEAGFHAGVLRIRPGQDVVLHYQSPYATVVACSKKIPSNFAVIPEVPYYVGEVAVVPYATPGSKGLVKGVVAAMAKHDLAVLRNHGQVVVGRTFEDAIQKAVFFELACEIIVRAGGSHQAMPAAGKAELSAMRKKKAGV